jgi:hypothetical protein
MSIGAIYEHLNNIYYYVSICNSVILRISHGFRSKILSYPLALVNHQLFNPTDNEQTAIVRIVSNITASKPTVLVVRTNRFFHVVDISHHVGHRFNTNFAFSIGANTFTSFQANDLKTMFKI